LAAKEGKKRDVQLSNVIHRNGTLAEVDETWHAASQLEVFDMLSHVIGSENKHQNVVDQGNC